MDVKQLEGGTSGFTFCIHQHSSQLTKPSVLARVLLVAGGLNAQAGGQLSARDLASFFSPCLILGPGNRQPRRDQPQCIETERVAESRPGWPRGQLARDARGPLVPAAGRVPPPPGRPLAGGVAGPRAVDAGTCSLHAQDGGE